LALNLFLSILSIYQLIQINNELRYYKTFPLDSAGFALFA